MIKVGDIVKIINIGQIYSEYKLMHEHFGFNPPMRTIKEPAGRLYRVVGVQKHFDRLDKTVYGLVDVVEPHMHAVMGAPGIELATDYDTKTIIKPKQKPNNPGIDILNTRWVKIN